MLQSGALPHPGIGPVSEDDPIRHHAYYQWVPFVLFAQALMFYLPHKLWRSWEGKHYCEYFAYDLEKLHLPLASTNTFFLQPNL